MSNLWWQRHVLCNPGIVINRGNLLFDLSNGFRRKRNVWSVSSDIYVQGHAFWRILGLLKLSYSGSAIKNLPGVFSTEGPLPDSRI